MPHVKNATRLFFFLFLLVLIVSVITSDNHHLVTLCFAAYGLGSIPFGYILARLSGHDLSKIGSGSIGATNVLRTGNKGLAIATLLLDAFKGWLAVFWLSTHGDSASATYVIALAAILGHLYPVWLDFKGGKGVATGFGVLIALNAPLALMGAALWLITVYWFRISSLAALVTFASLPLISLIFIDKETALFSLVLSALVFFSHADNIYRLIAGKEPKIGQR